jgi:hypothetical protein
MTLATKHVLNPLQIYCCFKNLYIPMKAAVGLCRYGRSLLKALMMKEGIMR